MTIYYFSPNVSDYILDRVYDLTKDECQQFYDGDLTENIDKYEDMKIFEQDFNSECISDLGFIRIFE
jgi:hypothetical protein